MHSLIFLVIKALPLHVLDVLRGLLLHHCQLLIRSLELLLQVLVNLGGLVINQVPHLITAFFLVLLVVIERNERTFLFRYLKQLLVHVSELLLNH